MRCGSCNEVFDGNAALLDPLATPLAIPQPAFAPVVSEAPYSPTPPPAPFDEVVAAPDDHAFEPPNDEPIYTLKLDSAVDETAQEWQPDQDPADEPEPEFGVEPEPEVETEVEPESEPEPELAPGDIAGQESIADDEQQSPPIEPAPEDPLDIKPMTHEELEAALAAELALMEQNIAAESVDQEAPSSPSTADPRQEPTLDPDSRYDLDEADEEALIQLAAARERDTTPQLPTLLRAASAPSQDHFAPQADVHSVEPPQPEVEAEDPDEPTFLKRDRRRERHGKTINIAMGVGSLLLVGALAAQGLTTFRNQLAASYPGLKPTLQGICATLGCKIELPTQIDELVIEQGELQTLTETTFSFTTLLRNQSTTAQTWPHIELVLDDANDKAILRRVFTPRDYLGAEAALEKGFAPRSEQSVKLYFELKQLKASGYHIAVFYP